MQEHNIIKDKDVLDAFSLVCSHMKELQHLYGQNNKEWELAFLIFAAGSTFLNRLRRYNGAGRAWQRQI